MADYTATTDLTLEQCITNGSMVNGENLTILSGATVTCTQTPSVLIGTVNIDDGEFFIDGVNISSGNVINFIQEWDNEIIVDGRGIFRVTGDWYDLGTTDGTNSQTISLSTYYGSTFYDVVSGIWVETGRRINFDGSSGTTPIIDDWVYKASDITVFGRIVEVQSTYLVVKYLTGTLANNDEIEIRKVVDNVGPDYQVSWSADVNHASGDIKESGVYQEFGNTVYDETSYLSGFGHTVSGFVFSHLPEATSLTMGSAVGGGFVPQSGCNIRVQNVNLTSSNTTNFPLGTVYNDRTATYQYRPNIVTSYAGDVILNKCNFGSYVFDSSNARVLEMYYVSSNIYCGSTAVATKVIINNCIGTSDPWAGGAPSYQYFKSSDLLSGVEIEDCLLVITRGLYVTMGIYTSTDITLHNNIVLMGTNISAESRNYRFYRSSDITFTNNIAYGGKHASYGTYNIYAESCSNITISDFKVSATIDGTYAAPETDMLGFTYCNDVSIIGIEILDGGIGGGSLVRLVDCMNFKIRCMGMADEKVAMNSVDFEYLLYTTGYAINIDMARLWVNSTQGSPYGVTNGSNENTNITIQNCSKMYDSTFRPRGMDTTLFKGVTGGSDSPGSSTGIDDSYSGSYGWAMHDGFRSDTVGYIVCLMIPESTNTSSSVTITAGDPKFNRIGGLYMVSGDVIEFEQSYFTKGHISFSGTYTSTLGGSAWNANEWTNVTVDFQYDIGSGWSGTWLDARTSTNWTGITITAATGVKLKYRFTATGTSNNMTMFIIDTVTSIAAQKANIYPIDQDECDVILNGIVVNSRYWIYDSDTDTEIAEGTAAADPVTETVTLPSGTNLLIRVRKSSASVKYKPLITTAVTNTTEINVAIIQQIDEIAT